MRVEAQVGEVGECLGTLVVVEGAEEVVFAVMHPGRRDGEVVADQGGEFEVLVAGPLANLLEFGAGEEAVVGVAADEVGLLADGETVVANLRFISQFFYGKHDCIRTGILFRISPGNVYGTGLWFPCSSKSANAGL